MQIGKFRFMSVGVTSGMHMRLLWLIYLILDAAQLLDSADLACSGESGQV